jgi:hypothetical protein
MIGFLEGTLLLSNILLILLAIVYALLIVKRHKRDDSNIWIYFLIACALFFISELLSFLNEFYFIEVGLIKNFLHVFFAIILLLAFITKYTTLQMK